MFSRAGYNPRMQRTGICAMARHTLYRGVYRVQLVRLACGDFAWYAPRCWLAWGHQMRFLNRFYLPYRVGTACPVEVPPADRAKWGLLVDLTKFEVSP